MRKNPIDKSIFSKRLQKARELLKVRTDQYDKSVRHRAVKKVLSDGLGSQNITNIPLAVERTTVEKPYARDYLTWSGADTILGPWVDTFVASHDPDVQISCRLLTETVADYVGSRLSSNLKSANRVYGYIGKPAGKPAIDRYCLIDGKVSLLSRL